MPPPPRRDVQRNRRLILDAARELFARGDDAPMYRIAEHAGVGQATLYRHFADRSLLAAAISGEALEELEREAAGGAETLEELLVRAARLNAATPGLRRMMLEGEGAAMVAESRARLGKLFDAPLREAKRDGRADGAITKGDLVLLLQMLEGGLNNASQRATAAERRKTSERAVELVIAALRSSS